MSTTSILRALSALAPAPTRQREVDPGDLIWLGMTPDRFGILQDPLVYPIPGIGETALTLAPVEAVGVDGGVLPGSEQLLGDAAAKATLNGATTVPVSWLTAVGWAPDASPASEPFVAPVLQTSATLGHRPLELGSILGALDRSWTLHRRSDWMLAAPVADEQHAASLLETMPWCGMVGHPTAGDRQLAQSPTLQAWLRSLAVATGWRIVRVTGAHPAGVATALAASGTRRPGDVTICVGYAVLPTIERVARGSAAALAAWADREGIDDTAFAALVAGSTDDAAQPDAARSDTGAGDPAAVRPGDDHELTSHVQLTAAQRRVARSTRTAPVTVVSGAPGTGKTHTIAAICADAVARGESVLIGTRTIEAASVIAELLARQPGPVPLRFGSPESLREAFAEIERRLAEQDTPGTGLAAQAQHDHLALRESAAALLTSLGAIDRAADGAAHLLAARRRAPGCFEPDADLDRIEVLLDLAATAPGWFGTSLGAGGRRRRAATTLGSLVGAEAGTVAQRADIAAALTLARGLQRSGDAPAIAAELEQTWPALEEAERSHRYWTGRALDHLTLERLRSRPARGALTTIDTALRSGPSSRQRLLTTVDRRAFRDAAPIWLGTLGEIERLLPPTAGWFDLVVIDEASQVDLALAAPALLRGSRCVVLGDPRQLRHVSFVADDAMQDAFEIEGVEREIGRLDVRRNSVFDIAAGVAPVTWLDEHHRSLPHLVQFSLDEFYDRVVAIATRFPTTECRDCIDVLDPRGDPVRTVVRRLRDLQRSGADDVGVVTPLRDLADRLQEVVLDELGPDAIVKMRLMVTTVHGFQGAERMHVIVVPGVDDASPAGRRRFVEDRHLFNVMVSRSRKHMDLVTDVRPDDASLLGRFVAWSHRPPPPAPDAEPTYRSAIGLGKALTDAGLEVRYRYPVGAHHVDVVVRRGERVIGIMCGVHPDGPDAHIERHLALRQTGWRLVDLVPSLDDVAVAARAIEIAGDLRS